MQNTNDIERLSGLLPFWGKLSASCLLSSITFDVFIDAQQETDMLLISSAMFALLQNENLYVENYVLDRPHCRKV